MTIWRAAFDHAWITIVSVILFASSIALSLLEKTPEAYAKSIWYYSHFLGKYTSLERPVDQLAFYTLSVGATYYALQQLRVQVAIAEFADKGIRHTPQGSGLR